jgi:hypothetical protein
MQIYAQHLERDLEGVAIEEEAVGRDGEVNHHGMKQHEGR